MSSTLTCQGGNSGCLKDILCFSPYQFCQEHHDAMVKKISDITGKIDEGTHLLSDLSCGMPVVLVASDIDHKYLVDPKSFNHSLLLKHLPLLKSESKVQIEFPLQIKNDILKLVVEYLNYVVEHPTEFVPIVRPLRSKNMSDMTSPWFANYIDTVGEDKKQLYALVMAAHYMEISSLVHLGCAKIASFLKDQPTEKIKSILSV